MKLVELDSILRKNGLIGDEPAVREVDSLAPELPFEEIWTPEPEANLVVPGMGIAPGPVHLVAGSWYTGKTLFLLSMGLAVASGRDVFGIHRVKRGRWTHFDHEMGRRHMKRYLQRLRTGLGVDPDELRGRMSLRVLPRLNLCTEGALDHYTSILEGCDFATFDPLRAAAPGQDENNSEFRQWLDMLAIVSDRTGCSIAVLHHGGKPTEGAQRRNTGRGTSAIDDAVQTKFVLTAEEKGAPILVSHEKTRELPDTLQDFYLEIDSGPDHVRLVHRDAEEMGDTLEDRKASREADKLARAAERAKTRVREMFAKHAGVIRGNRQDVLAIIGGHRPAVSGAVSDMVSSGEISSDGRGEDRVWTIKRYSVPNGTQPVPNSTE
jgi:RecA-family ATPase